MRYRKKYKYRKKWWAGMFPLLFILSACIYVMDSSGMTKNTILDSAVRSIQADLGYRAAACGIPMLAYDESKYSRKTIYEYLADGMDELLPIYSYARGQGTLFAAGMQQLPDEAADDSCGNNIDALTAQRIEEENEQAVNAAADPAGQGAPDEAGTAGQDAVSGVLQNGGRVRKYSREKLNDFDYLLQNFYRVDSTTTTNSRQLNAAEMLAKDMCVDKKKQGPQILIYHTHSQERYADSKDETESVVGLGDELTALLEDCGYQVLHHKGKYDVPDRDNAYSKAAPALEQLLKENPGIEVVIDLHRDGVAEGTRLVEKINGKDTATIMFFNGLSHTTAQGDISYLYNPNLSDNLAFSFQLQLAAAEYYPGFSRCVYLKGYRYNLHYLPKSLLVEVGAQTNTYQEARNAMPLLADVLDKVLSGET